NYARAESRNLDAMLPRSLFQTNGDWVNIAADGREPIARSHVSFFGGRSVFQVFLRHPEGRQAGIDCLKRLGSFSPYVAGDLNLRGDALSLRLNPDLPQFPTN